MCSSDLFRAGLEGEFTDVDADHGVEQAIETRAHGGPRLNAQAQKQRAKSDKREG